MNAARITGAAVLGLAFAVGAAYAQDATTTPYKDNQQVEKSESAKTPSAKSDQATKASNALEDTSKAAQDQAAAPEPKGRPQAIARNELNATSIQRLAKLEDFDKNKDGSLSKEEAPANDALGMSFQSYDKDGDGKISQAEFAQYRNGGAGNRQLARNKPKAESESKPEQQ